jgi:hypothetical protein
MRTKQLVIGAAAAMACLAISARAAHADDVCVQGAVKYQLQIGTVNPASGTPIVVTGIRAGADSTPVAGSLIVVGNLVKVGFEESFDFGTGVWVHPNGTTVLTYNQTTGAFTYDTTYHGSGAPSNVKGAASFLACPVTPPAALDAGDPNRK